MDPIGINILRTRLLPPRLPTSSLLRVGLVERVIAGLDARLVAVVAAAGYGKSTLLAQALAVGGRRRWAWCSCDARLATPAQLLAHIVAGLGEIGPAIALRPDDPPPAQVEVIANALIAGGDDVVLALDDVHLLPPRAAATLGLLLSDVPPNVHFVLASRERLPVPIARLRPHDVLEIGESELALTEAEAVDLLYAAGLASGPHQAAELHRLTEGWVAGLLIGAHVERALADATTDSQEHMFEYLGEEVLAHLPAELQRFLVATSVFDRFTPELADAVTGEGDSRRLARELVERHLFTVRLEGGEEWYRYHGMFLRFLRRHLAGEGPARRRELHLRAGESLVAAGLPSEAIDHLLLARAHARAADVLEPIAEEVARSSDAPALAGWLRSIPETLRAERPALVVAQGLILHQAGDHEHALETLERAVAASLRSDDAERESGSLLRLLQVALAADMPERGVDIVDRLLVEAGAIDRTPPAAAVSLAYCCTWSLLRRSDAARALLLATAHEGWFDAATANDVCGSADAPHAIDELERVRLVLARQGDGERSWQHRPLLAAFLLARSRLPRLGETHVPACPAVPRGPPTRPPIRVLALGRLEVWRGDSAVEDLAAGRAAQGRTLLAILLAAGRPVHREILLELLWPGRPPHRAIAALHSALHALRRSLEPARGRRGDPSTVIVTEGDAYRLVLDGRDSCDAHELLRVVRREDGEDRSDRLARLVRAEAAYRGPFLAEWPYDDWAAPLRGELERAHASVQEELAGLMLTAGDIPGAIERYRRILASDGDRECIHRALMECYARGGERALAVRQYHECRAALRERHGLDPSAETEALFRRLLV